MENQQLPQGYYGDEKDEITLKELILKFRGYYKECRKHWKIILLFILPFIGYQLFLRFTKPAYYSASLTFMVNETKGSSISGLLGQFSGLIGGGDDDNMDKILELSKIRRTIFQSLLTEAVIDGKKDLIANHFIEIEDVHDSWKKDKQLANFKFHERYDSSNIIHNRALSELHRLLVGSERSKGLFTTVKNKKTGIMSFNLTTQSESLTITLINQIFTSLSNFYVYSTIRKEQESFDILSAKKDSIEALLRNNDVASARHDDMSNNLLLNVDKVPTKRFNRNNQVLSTLYAEVVKNTELAEFALKTSTPYITLIEDPIPPILPIKKGKLTSIILFGILGFLLGSGYVVLRKIVRDAT